MLRTPHTTTSTTTTTTAQLTNLTPRRFYSRYGPDGCLSQAGESAQANRCGTDLVKPSWPRGSIHAESQAAICTAALNPSDDLTRSNKAQRNVRRRIRGRSSKERHTRDEGGGENRTASSPAMCLTRIPRSARPGGVTEGVRTFKKQIKASSVSAKETFLEQLRRTEKAEQDDGSTIIPSGRR